LSLSQEYSGRLMYLSGLEPTELLLAVPCRVGDLGHPDVVLLDTAAEWCVLPPATAEELGVVPSDTSLPAQLSTRFGTFAGYLERLRVTFEAEEGMRWKLTRRGSSPPTGPVRW
jgi:hypothetical protein